MFHGGALAMCRGIYSTLLSGLNMTRLNLVPVQELMDQHLFAEFREIKMVPKSLARSLRAAQAHGRPLKIPASFTLNAGHVSFFYDKGAYLHARFHQLRAELVRRAYNINFASELDPDGVYLTNPQLNGHYTPTAEALAIIRERIAEKIAMKPEWYRHSGVNHTNTVAS